MKPASVLLIDVSRTSLDTSMDMLEYPLGLVYVGTALRHAFGNAVAVRIESFDARTHDLRHFRSLMEECRPSILGLRALTMGRKPFHELATFAKRECGVPHVIAGGPHATDSPEDVMANDAFDCAVLGEGEETAVELVRALLDDRPIAGIPGLAVRSASGVTRTPPRPPIRDLDSIPMPDYDLVDFLGINRGHVDFSFRHNVAHANLFTSRGCPYRCLYCHQVFGKKFRTHSPDRIAAEIRMLYERYGIFRFQIIDDIFNLDRSRAMAICDKIVGSGVPAVISFPNGLRGDRMDPELIDAMWQAGVRYVAYAIESGSPRIQKLIRKNLNLERIAEAISLTTAKGIVTRGFFMLGFPTETVEEAMMTVDFARSSDLILGLFFTVVYFPGTPLAKLAKELTDFTDYNLELEDDYVHTRDGPYAFTRECLEEIKLRAVREFYFSPKRIRAFFERMPNFFSQKDIDAVMLATIISARLKEEQVARNPYSHRLHNYFLVADRFSKRSGFYV